MSTRTAHCNYCGRDNVPVTVKGGFSHHTDASGKQCIGFGMRAIGWAGRVLTQDLRTPKKGDAKHHRAYEAHQRKMKLAAARAAKPSTWTPGGK